MPFRDVHRLIWAGWHFSIYDRSSGVNYQIHGTRRRSNNPKLPETPGQSRLLIGPQVTNVPHKAAEPQQNPDSADWAIGAQLPKLPHGAVYKAFVRE